MTKQSSHVVHLAVTSAGVGAASIDLFQDDRSLGKTESATAIFFRNQGGQPARFRERLHKFFGIRAFVVLTAKVFVRKVVTKLPYRSTNIFMRIGLVHHQESFLSVIRAQYPFRPESPLLPSPGIH